MEHVLYGMELYIAGKHQMIAFLVESKVKMTIN